MLPAIWRALLPCLLITSGCQAILGIEDLRGRADGGATNPDAGPGTDATGPDAGIPGFSFAVLTVNATIPFHGTNLLDVEIQRTGGFTGEVEVAAMSPPTGLMVEPLTIPPGQTAAQLAVSAQAPLAQGDTVSFDLVATADALPARMASVRDAEITGQPGTFDDTFGLDATGYSAISFGADDDGAFFDLDVLGNGNILAFGWGTGGLGARRFALLRLGADGRPDPSFNSGTLVRTGFESGSSGDNAQGYAVGRQVDGRIIGIGWHSATSEFPPNIGLVRYSAAGAVGDVEFGNNGRSRIGINNSEQVTDGLVLPDSKIVVVGQSNGRLFIARATATGNLDDTFAGGAGYDLPNISPQSGAEAVAVDEDGRLVVAGFDDFDGNRDMVVLRYTADGVLDMTFGDRGVVRLGLPGAAEHAMAIVARPNGRIVVAGTTNAGGNVDFSMRQLREDGTPDPDFGAMGVNEEPISPGNDVPADMALLPDGRLVVVGNSTALGPVVVRYGRAGSLDAYFGDGDGILTPYIGESGSLQAVEVYAKNKVLLAGGNAGGTPGPGTFGIVVRMWM